MPPVKSSPDSVDVQVPAMEIVDTPLEGVRRVLRPGIVEKIIPKKGEVHQLPMSQSFIDTINRDEDFSSQHYNGLSEENKHIVDTDFGKKLLPDLIEAKRIEESEKKDNISNSINLTNNESVSTPSEIRNQSTEEELKAKDEKISEALQKLLEMKIGKTLASAEESLETLHASQIAPEVVVPVEIIPPVRQMGGEIRIPKPVEVITPIAVSVTQENVIAQQVIPQSTNQVTQPVDSVIPASLPAIEQPTVEPKPQSLNERFHSYLFGKE